jgi:hypothetical protein
MAYHVHCRLLRHGGTHGQRHCYASATGDQRSLQRI